MNQRILVGAMVSVGLLAAALYAQPPKAKGGGAPTAQAMKLFTTSAEVQQLIEKSKSERTKGQATITQRILSLAPINASLEYRAGVGPAAIHDTEAEMFYVIEGSATMITGGKLVGDTVTGTNHQGTAIEGGESREIAKGDFIMVPEKTAHWYSKINGVLVLMSLHIPHQ